MKKLVFTLFLLLNAIVLFGQNKADIIKEINNIINSYGAEYQMEYPGNRQTVSAGLTSTITDGLYYKFDNERETDENGKGGYHYSFSGDIPWSNVCGATYSLGQDLTQTCVLIKLKKSIKATNTLGNDREYNEIRFFIQDNNDKKGQYPKLKSLLVTLGTLNGCN